MNETVHLQTENIWLDSSHRYGLISRALHWIMAYLLIYRTSSLNPPHYMHKSHNLDYGTLFIDRFCLFTISFRIYGLQS